MTIMGQGGLQAACAPSAQTHLLVLSVSRRTDAIRHRRLHCEGSIYLCEAQWGLNARQEADRPQALLPWLEGPPGIYRAPGGTFVLRHLF